MLQELSNPTSQTTTTSNNKNKLYMRLGLIVISLIAITYCVVKLESSPLELVIALAGMAALWLPIGTFIYLLLPHQFPDNITRCTFSAIASYTLTTLAYFGFSVIGVDWLFYVALTVLSIGTVIYGVRNQAWKRLAKTKLNWGQVDWLLIALISVSIVTNMRYQIPFDVSPQTGERSLLINGDQTYFTALSSELARHTPPLQQAIQAGVAERAYHLFPHLTLMLLNRFTLQSDMLHTQFSYHYTFIEILYCLVVYCLVNGLTGSKWGGYMGMSLVYLLAVPFRAIKVNSLDYYYFTLYPHVSSGMQGMTLTSPQMYSGILVLLGLLLGVLYIRPILGHKQNIGILVCVLALMVGAMLRFRIQIFIPLLSGFLLLLSYLWLKRRQKTFLLAIGIVFATSLLLYLEMQSSIYLPNTAKIGFGYNDLTDPASGSNWLNSWPLSDHVYNWLHSVLPGDFTFLRVWQFVSLPGFVLFNMLSFPLLIAIFFYLRSKAATKEHIFFTVMIFWLLVTATLGAMVITTSYDNYSVGGQMLLHTYWYVFPLLGVLAWRLYQFLQMRLKWHKWVWGTVGLTVILVSLAIQFYSGPTAFEKQIRSNGIVINNNEWATLLYLRDQTPKNSIIISNHYLEPYFAVFAGIAGRAAYFSYLDNGGVADAFEVDDRKQIIHGLWSIPVSAQFCKTLTSTVATHLVEYSGQPLSVQNSPCLQQIWASPDLPEKITIWQIKR